MGDAEARLNEDRLRALRAIRFASRFDFAIEPETWRAIVGSALVKKSEEAVALGLSGAALVQHVTALAAELAKAAHSRR